MDEHNRNLVYLWDQQVFCIHSPLNRSIFVTTLANEFKILSTLKMYQVFIIYNFCPNNNGIMMFSYEMSQQHLSKC